MSTQIVSAQKIVYDNIDSNGLRTISTNSIVIAKNWNTGNTLKLSLHAYTFSTDTTIFNLVFSLSDRGSISVHKGGQLLIKLTNDHVICLTANSDSEDIVGTVYSGAGGLSKYYEIYPSYDISKEELLQIAAFGVKKIRIEMSPENYDKDFSKDKIGAAVTTLFNPLVKASREKKSFDDGF